MNRLVKSGQTSRILVDLNVASGIELSVRTATTLAAAVGADVHGLFIQEQSLLDLAALPFSRAITTRVQRSVELSPKAMMEAFNRHSVRSRRILSMQADKASVSWSFSIERGDLQQKIQAALSSGDFLVIGGNGHGLHSRQLLKELRSSPEGTRGIVLTPVDHAQTNQGPVVAIDDGDKLGRETVELAARIALIRSAALHLFVIAVSDNEGKVIINRANAALQANQKLVTHRFLPDTPKTLAAYLKQLRPGFVVADLVGAPSKSDSAALQLCRAARAPIVLLKPPVDLSVVE